MRLHIEVVTGQENTFAHDCYVRIVAIVKLEGKPSVKVEYVVRVHNAVFRSMTSQDGTKPFTIIVYEWSAIAQESMSE